MSFVLPDRLEDYVSAHTSPEDPVLSALARETHLKALLPRMLSGHVQGRLLSFLSQMIAPMRALEIGTYTGYSAICLARGLAPGGRLWSIDLNEELTDMAHTHLEKAGLSDQVELLLGDALAVIPDLEGPFDLVFLDADKKSYEKYYEAVLPKLRPGGWILADNVLWSGRVLEAEQDSETAAIHAFNTMIQDDERVENLMLSVRDGLTIARKIG